MVAASHSLSRSSQAEGVPRQSFSLRVLFPQPKDKKLSSPSGTAKMIFNELKRPIFVPIPCKKRLVRKNAFPEKKKELHLHHFTNFTRCDLQSLSSIALCSVFRFDIFCVCVCIIYTTATFALQNSQRIHYCEYNRE